MNRMKRTSHVFMTSAMLAAVTMGIVRPASAQHEGHQTTGRKPATPGTTTAGAAVSPTPVWQISGPAEAAVQAFQDAMQVGNRELATRWLAPEVTIVASGVTDPSREAYASRRMGLDMAFLKASRVVLLDRQVQQDADSARVVSSARITGRDGEMSVDVLRTESAQLARTAEGWRVVRLEWSAKPTAKEPAASAPVDHSKMSMGTAAAAKPATGATPSAPAAMDHSKMPMSGAPAAKPATGTKPSAPAAMDHSKMPMGTAPTAKPATGAKPSAPAAMDHSKMPMGAASAAKPATGDRSSAPTAMDHSKMPMGAAPAAKSAPGAKPPAPAVMDHSKMPMDTDPANATPRAVDPVCGLHVDPATAPQATHGPHTYSFCSEQHQQLFQKNPAKYLPKAK